MSSKDISPNHREILYARSSITGVSEYLTSTNHVLDTAGSGGGGAVTIADGADITQGALADAAITAGSTGSISGKLRQISSDIGTIQTRTPALGQALAAASTPVVLTAAQITTLTPPAAITNYALETGGNLATIVSNQTNATQQAKITDGTNIVGVLKNDGTIASTQNAQIVAGTGYTTSTVSLSAGTQNTGWYDMLNYAWVSVEILTNTTPATLTFQTSGDAAQTNINSVQLMSAGGTAFTTTTTSAVATFHGPRSGRYFRISSNLAGGNTATMVLTFFTNPASMPGVYVTQTGTWNVGSTSATGSAIPANVFAQGGLARTTSPTAATTGNLVSMLTDVMGEQLIATGGLVTTAVPANASNVVVKPSAGRLCNVLITATGVTPMVIYDNATTNSGTVIGALPASPTLGNTYSFSMPAANGITIAGSATNPAVTVSWV